MAPFALLYDCTCHHCLRRFRRRDCTTGGKMDSRDTKLEWLMGMPIPKRRGNRLLYSGIGDLEAMRRKCTQRSHEESCQLVATSQRAALSSTLDRQGIVYS